MKLRLHLAASVIFLELSGAAALPAFFLPASRSGNWIDGIAQVYLRVAGFLVALVAGLIAANVSLLRARATSDVEMWRKAFRAGTWPLALHAPLGLVDPRLLLCLVPPAVGGALLAARPVAPQWILALLPAGALLVSLAVAAPDWLDSYQRTRASVDAHAFQDALRGVEFTGSGSEKRTADVRALVDVLASKNYVVLQASRERLVETELARLLADRRSATSSDEIPDSIATILARVDLVLGSRATVATPWVTLLRGIEGGTLPPLSLQDPALFADDTSRTAALLYAAEKRDASITRTLCAGLPERAWHAALVRLLGYGLEHGRWLLETAGVVEPSGKIAETRVDRDFVSSVILDLTYYEGPSLLGSIVDLDTALVALMAFDAEASPDAAHAKHLLAQGARINGTSPCGATPLSALASHNGHDRAALGWLLAEGADVNLAARAYCGAESDAEERALVATPLWLLLNQARRKPRPDGEPALVPLLDHGADWRRKDAQGRTLPDRARALSPVFAETLSVWVAKHP